MDDETLHKAADAAYGTFYPNADPTVTGKAKAWKGDTGANPMLRPLKAALAVIDEERPDQSLEEKLNNEQMLSDALFKGLDNVPLFTGWRKLRNRYLSARGWPTVGSS